MAASAAVATSAERAQLDAHAQRIVTYVRQTDPEATYAIEPPFDPDIWVLVLHVRADLANDPEFGERVAEHAVDVLIEHDVALVTLLRAR